MASMTPRTPTGLRLIRYPYDTNLAYDQPHATYDYTATAGAAKDRQRDSAALKPRTRNTAGAAPRNRSTASAAPRQRTTASMTGR